jgi:hypothetical protein
MQKKIALFLVLFFIISFGLFAQGENLTIKIAVIGPGSELYFWWGHIALVIENSITGRSQFYDYGIFSFDDENFFYNFAFGRLTYSCGASRTDVNILFYQWTNRSVVFYTLDLPAETKLKVKEFAEINVLPENSDYAYHHFKDNCSTRIRDLIDYATDGQFMEKYGHMPSNFTLRDHVRRHTWFFPPADWALNFWMGQVIDRPITVWEDMFLPSEVGKRINEFWYTDVNGIYRKLVPNEDAIELIFACTGRPGVLEAPRKQWPINLAFSIVLSLVFGFFFYLYSKGKRVGRVLAGISMSLYGLILGAASLLLYFMNIFTDHDYTNQNYNMIFGTPLLLAAVPIGLFYAFTKSSQKLKIYDELLRLLFLLTSIGIVISMLIKILPWFYQQNLPDQLLMLPISLVFAFQPVGLRSCLEKYFKSTIFTPIKGKKHK